MWRVFTVEAPGCACDRTLRRGGCCQMSTMSCFGLPLQVEPLLARQLYYFAQQNSGHFLRGYDLPEPAGGPEDFHRPPRHSSIQE